MLFGLYYIPFKTEFYERGSKILGYDIFEKKRLVYPREVDEIWVTEARQYGFHMTITDAVTINENELLVIENKVHEILNCFTKNLDFSLSVDEIGFWPNDNSQLAIRLKPNENVKILHNILVCTIQKLGSGSLYSDVLAEQTLCGKIKYTTDQVEKIKMFHSPYIFENFKPHFTLLNPFFGDEDARNKVERFILKNFDKSASFSMDTITMVKKNRNDDYFEIQKVFNL